MDMFENKLFEMLSTDPEFKKLLLLHGRDRRKKKLEQELTNLPEELSVLERKISDEKQSIDLAIKAWKDLELENNTLENEILNFEDSIHRQRTKQLEVKKNEEYQALENEISTLQCKQALKEDLQINVLVKIDDAKLIAQVAEDKISKRVKELENKKNDLVARKVFAVEELNVIQDLIKESEQEVEDSILIVYRRVKKIVSRPPYVAPLDDQKCTGCNLRVSNDVVSSALVEQKITQCDQCGRILYVER